MKGNVTRVLFFQVIFIMICLCIGQRGSINAAPDKSAPTAMQEKFIQDAVEKSDPKASYNDYLKYLKAAANRSNKNTVDYLNNLEDEASDSQSSLSDLLSVAVEGEKKKQQEEKPSVPVQAPKKSQQKPQVLSQDRAGVILDKIAAKSARDAALAKFMISQKSFVPGQFQKNKKRAADLGVTLAEYKELMRLVKTPQ